jgi:hypothetical protein
VSRGLASAKTLTLSWWVKSSIAPYTYAVAFQNFAQNRSFVVNKTITIRRGLAAGQRDVFG